MTVTFPALKTPPLPAMILFITSVLEPAVGVSAERIAMELETATELRVEANVTLAPLMVVFNPSVTGSL